MTILPEPNQVLGNGKDKKLPSPDQVFAEPKPEIDAYTQALTAPDKLSKLNTIIEQIPELPGDSESKKSYFKELVLKGTPTIELQQALETLAGKHPHQEGGMKYYIDEKGLPRPLKNSERPPKGFEVASIWGSKSDAKDDSPLTDLAKTVFNVLPSAAENVVDLTQTGYELLTGESSDTLNSLKNAANYLKFEKDPDIQKSILNTDGIDEFGDVLESERWDLSPNALWGTVLGLTQSVGEMYVGGSAVGKGITGVTGKALTNPQVAAATYAGSFLTNLGEARDAAEQAGLTGRDKAIFSALVTAPIAAIDAKYDLGGKILSSSLIQQEKNAFIKEIAGNVAARTAEGTLTQEALDGLAKATTVGYSQLAKKWSKETLTDVLQQGGEEAAQTFMLNAGEQLWDKLTDEEKAKFGKNAFSAESFAEYLRDGLSGAIGGAPTAFAFSKVKEAARKENQSNTAYGIATKGPQAVDAFKQNVSNEVKLGKITPAEGANAIFQVEAYSQYNEQIKNLELNDQDKRRVFDLTFEKANLESQIPTDYQAEKLNGIAQAEIDVKKKKAKDIQDEINKIILREDVQNKADVRAKKTEEQVAKDIEKEGDGAYKTPQFVLDETRTYEQIPIEEWNKPKFNTRLKKYKLADYLDTIPEKTIQGVVNQDYKKEDVDTFNVTLPDGKTVRFASSMIRKPEEGSIGGFRGNTYEENFSDRKNPIGQKVGVTVKTLKDSGRKVMFVWNADKASPKYGKHIGMVKESLKGKSNYSEADLEEMADLRMTNMGFEEGGSVVEHVETPTGPITPADVKIVPPKVELGQPTRENLRNKWINKFIEEHKKEGSYLKEYEEKGIYADIYGKKFDKLNPTLYAEQPTERTTVAQEELVAGEDAEVNRDDIGESKTTKARKGKPTIQQKIKDPTRIEAMTFTVYSPKAIIMQYFIGGGKVSFDAVKTLLNNSQKEAMARTPHMTASTKRGKKIAPSLDDLAHSLWEGNKDFTPFADDQDYKNDLEEVINEYTSVVQMAKDLIETYTEKEQAAPVEEIVSDMHAKAEDDKTGDYVNAIQEELEKESTDNIDAMSQDQSKFDKWEDDTNISYYEGDIQWQKSKELEYAEAELIKAEKELSASKKAFDAKRKELDQGLIEDQEDLFGERKSTQESGLFDERASVDARNEAVKPFKDRYDAAVKNYNKWLDKVRSLEGTEDNQTSLFQKVSEKKELSKKTINKIVDTLQKSMPKVRVVYNEDLNVAGYVYKDSVFINPNYAGIDTPIHEYGHILIDSMGYNNPIIQDAIKQLKTSPLWNETKDRYPELNEEMLAKEVLAEVIGREGADVFESISKENKFKKILDKIFTWLKEKLGIEKNIAKKLAKQLLRGEGTQEITSEYTQVQKQKVKEKIAELQNKSTEDLLEMRQQMIEDGKTNSPLFRAIKVNLGYKLFTERKKELSANDRFVEKLADKKDISKKDILFKNLSHMSENVPELQAFSNMFDNSAFDMVEENYDLNEELEKRGKAVIKEANEKLGIKGKAASLFSSDNAKYFEYLENPNAYEEIDEDTGKVTKVPGFWTVEEAKAKGFTKAQIEFLEFMRKLVDLRNEQYEQSGNAGSIDELLKVDKGFKETLKTEGIVEAFSAYLGNSYALKETEIEFVDPVTGKKDVIAYGDVERKLIDYGKKGKLEKLHALLLMLKYNFRARRQSKEKVGQFNISPTGQLNNKFLKPRDRNRGYSKDFYKAAHSFINDYTHAKHMSKLLPYIDAIEALNEAGFKEHGKKENVVKWMQEWKDMHIFKNEKQGKLGPEVDAGLRFIRSLTSQIVMGFNVPAGLINAAVGQYNNWRQGVDGAIGGKGHGRMFSKKGVDKKAVEILKKYQVVASDYDSNPKLYAGRLFDNLAHGLTRLGEFYIQGSMFMGLMSDQDYNSFEYKDGKLSIKEGIDKEALKKRMIANKNKVSDIQGKYAEKDRRNYLNTEFGKTASQFKTWIPDWWKERFGAEYINAKGEVKKGTYRDFTLDAVKDLRDYIKENGLKGVIGKSDKEMTPEAKNFLANLKGAMFIGAMLSLRLAGDDDEKNRRKGDLVSQMLSNVLFVFDPTSLKFTIERPIAAVGTVTKFIDALDYALPFEEDDFYKSKGRFGNKGDMRLWGSLGQLLPYNKLLINDITFPKN